MVFSVLAVSETVRQGSQTIWQEFLPDQENASTSQTDGKLTASILYTFLTHSMFIGVFFM